MKNKWILCRSSGSWWCSRYSRSKRLR